MKLRTSLLGLVLIAFLAGSTGCHSHVLVFHKRGNLPPGQAKKVAGSKSAKPFAPGQQKKKKNNP